MQKDSVLREASTIYCTHSQLSDWPRTLCLFWEFTWFCGQAWLEYNLLSNYICRLYRVQCACIIHFLLKSVSTWMVLSDVDAWCICPCIFRSTNKIYLHFTQQFLYISHKTMYTKTIIEFGFLWYPQWSRSRQV